jgi:hypothetical protein
MRTTSSKILLLLMSLSPGALIWGAGLNDLMHRATAVVLGSVTSRTEAENEVSFSINVTSVIQGAIPGSAITVVHPWVGLVRGRARTGGEPLFGIWFLTAGPSGNWDLLPARPSLFLPASASPGGANSLSADAPILDALVYRVAEGVQTARSGSPDADPGALADAIGSMNSPAVQAVLATSMASGEPGLQAVGLAGSLLRMQPGVIQQLVRLWPGVSVDPHRDQVISALRNWWRDPEAAGVRQLAAMAGGASGDIRSAAIRALAAIHTKETLPFLATLLNSAVPDEQERAVYALSAFANGCPLQTANNAVSMGYLQCNQASPYKTAETEHNFAFRPGTPDQEAPFVSFWQNWWTNHPELH